MATVDRSRRPAGELLREWRRRRGLSQLELASRAAISTRHLSFVETGRSRPSPEMVTHLADELEIPLRERNGLLMSAGYAPTYRRTDLDDPAMSSVRDALESLLTAHQPYPALVVNRQWEMMLANDGALAFVQDADPELLSPPVNVLRLSLHPAGLAARIVNLAEWSAHLLTRLRREVLLTGDEQLAKLHEELQAYPGVQTTHRLALESQDILVPLRLRSAGGVLSFFSTVTTFGTPVDLTLAELSIEAFYPADSETSAALRHLVPASQ